MIIKYRYGVLSILFLAMNLLPAETFSQKVTFGLASYIAPKTWKKTTNGSVVQFTKENTATGDYCAITLLKDMPGGSDAKSNFNVAWETLVKESVTVSAAPD